MKTVYLLLFSMFFCSLYLKAEYSDVVMKEAKKETARLKTYIRRQKNFH